MALSYIEFKAPIDVASDIKVDGTSLGSNAFFELTEKSKMAAKMAATA